MADFPLHFSEKSLDYILSKVQPNTEAGGIHIHLKTTGCNGYQITLDPLDHQPEGCEVMWLHGVRFLIDDVTKERVEGTHVTLNEMEFGQKKLMFVHPKATHVCGCGESFTLED